MLPNYNSVEELFSQCGLTLTPSLYTMLDQYAIFLVKCNEMINLTSIVEPNEIIIKHFIDSIVISNMICIPENAKVIDVGTGAGFPLLPLKLYRPDISICLLDSQLKRVKFLQDLTYLLRVDAEIVHDRAELLSHNEKYREKFDVCVSRAVAPLPVLCEFCIPFVKCGGDFAALKGPNEDAMDFQSAYKELGCSLLGQNDYELPNGDARRLILIEKISQTSTDYPRKSAHIMRNPL